MDPASEAGLRPRGTGYQLPLPDGAGELATGAPLATVVAPALLAGWSHGMSSAAVGCTGAGALAGADAVPLTNVLRYGSPVVALIFADAFTSTTYHWLIFR